MSTCVHPNLSGGQQCPCPPPPFRGWTADKRTPDIESKNRVMVCPRRHTRPHAVTVRLRRNTCRTIIAGCQVQGQSRSVRPGPTGPVTRVSGHRHLPPLPGAHPVPRLASVVARQGETERGGGRTGVLPATQGWRVLRTGQGQTSCATCETHRGAARQGVGVLVPGCPTQRRIPTVWIHLTRHGVRDRHRGRPRGRPNLTGQPTGRPEANVQRHSHRIQSDTDSVKDQRRQPHSPKLLKRKVLTCNRFDRCHRAGSANETGSPATDCIASHPHSTPKCLVPISGAAQHNPLTCNVDQGGSNYV